MNKAISHEEFSKILHDKNFIYEKNPHVAVGVSGGVDSIALLILVNNWIKKQKGCLTVVHFDHKIRKHSNLDAEFVKSFSMKLGVECKILKWSGLTPSSSLMKKARDQRYEKILNYCRVKKIITLMTAHHLEDSIETYLMRKRRKHSTLGLAGIPTFNNRSFIQIFRPLLNIEKERLIKTCLRHKITWIEDSNNKNKKFERVRVRETIRKFSETKKKIIIRDLKLSIKNNNKIEEKLSTFFCKNLELSEFGVFTVRKENLIKLSHKLQVEVLKKILVTCSGSIYPPKKTKIELFLKKNHLNKMYKTSLHCCILKVRKNLIHIYREYNKIIKTTPDCINIRKNKSFMWDGRFEIYASKYDLNCLVMDDKIWLKLKKKYNRFKTEKQISFEILKTLPVIEAKKEFFIPFLDSNEDDNNYPFEIKFKPQIPITKKNF